MRANCLLIDSARLANPLRMAAYSALFYSILTLVKYRKILSFDFIVNCVYIS